MTQEHIEMLQDAWFPLRDVAEEEPNAEVISIMNRLHELIDRELEKLCYNGTGICIPGRRNNNGL